jgi:hypothetical protein
MECDSSSAADDSMEVDEDQRGITWKFSQLKGVVGPGDELPAEGNPLTLDHCKFSVDTITAVQFSDDDGELLATGDRGGRIVIFKRNQVCTL